MLRRLTQTIAYLILMQTVLLNTFVAASPTLALSADVIAPIFLHSPNIKCVIAGENGEIIATVTKTATHALPHTHLFIN